MKKFLFFFGLLLCCLQINAQYCTPTTFTNGCELGDSIDSFTIPLAGFSHLNTGCSPNNYGDFSSDTSLEINLSVGTSYDFNIEHGFDGQNVKIWIDLNQDEIFQTGELLFTSPQGEILTIGSFIVPNSAPQNISTRMRIVDVWGEEVTDPCTPDGSFGEFHDYTVNILPQPSCPNPTNVQAINVQDVASEFSWDNLVEATNGYIWEVFITGEDPNTSSPISSGNFPAGSTSGLVENLSTNTSYDFYLTADCGVEGTSISSTPVTFSTTITCPPPTDVLITNITSTTADVSWETTFNDNLGYNWQIFLEGEDPNNSNPIFTGTFLPDTDNSTITGLNPDTNYDFYFSKDCGVDGVSSEVGPISFFTLVNCPSPTLISLTNATTDSLEITWQETFNATGGYLWELYTVDSDPSTDTPLQDGTVAFGENSLSINGLSDNQEYDFYISSDCGVAGNSLSEGPFSFLTLALAPANDNLCDAIPLNINEICSGNNYTNFGATAEENEPEGNCFNGGINGSVWFSFVAPSSGEVQVSTDIAGATLTDTEIAIYTAPEDCSDLTTLGTELACDQDGGQVINFNSIVTVGSLVPGDTYYIQVDRWNSTPDGDFGISVIDTSLSCLPPEGITVESSTTNAISISWEEVPNAIDGYNWYVHEVGANICTETPIASGSEGVGDLIADINGLQSNTTYSFYVESLCGSMDGSSYISVAFEFSTACEIFTAPYFQDFESFTQTFNLESQECFVENSSGTTFSWDVSSEDTPSNNTGPSSAFSGTKFIYCEATDGETGDFALIETPIVDISTLSEPVLSFYYHMFGQNMGTLHVDIDDGTGFVEDVFVLSGQQQDSSDADWIQQFVPIGDIFGSNVKFRFRAEKGDDFQGDIAIDDIAIIESPSCLQPINLTIDEVFYNTFTVSWDEVSNAINGYIWEVYLAGEEQGVDSPISSGIIPSGISQVIVDNLESETAYEFYIASDCGSQDGLSVFSNGLDITTTEFCVLPSTFEVVNITTNSLELQWSSVPNAINGYNWSIFVSGDDPTTATPVISGNTSSSENSVFIDTNISSGQLYEAYIFTDCGGGEQSDLSEVLSFQTPCEVFLAPYSENFDALPWLANSDIFTNDDIFDPCWENVSSPNLFDWSVSSGSSSFFETGPTIAHSTENFIITGSLDGIEGEEAILYSPLIDLSTLNEPVLSFWYYMYGQTITTLNIDIDNGTTIDTEVFSITGLQQTGPDEEWLQQYVDLSAYVDQSIRVIFRVERGPDISDIAIDSFSIEEAPNCFNPTNLEVLSVTDISVDITWLPGAEEDVFDVEIVSAGTPPSGTPNYENVSFPYTAEGLTPLTDYEFYVRADCGDGDVSDWIGPVSFTTIVSAIIVQVDAPLVNYTYCYENNETKEWLFVSSDGETAVQIQFEAGTIEDGNESEDRLLVYDGSNSNGIVLFDSDLDGTDLTGVNLSADSGSAYMILTTDNFGSCLNGGLDQEIAFDFNVFSGTVSSVEFSNQNFKFYPNPVSSLLTINSYYPVEEIQIFDILGKALIRTTLNSTSNTIDLNTLTNGTYLMKVKINNKTQTFKLFKD